MSNSLSKKVALVTGGSRGIGAAIVRRLAQNGASVAFTYSASESKASALAAEVKAACGNALPINADSANAEEVKQAVVMTAKTYGGIDILVNNAGILKRGTVDEFSLSDFDQMVAINVRAVFVAIQAALPHMPDNGRIITIGSVTGDRIGGPSGNQSGGGLGSRDRVILKSCRHAGGRREEASTVHATS